MYNDYGQPYIKFDVHFDPLISWFSADNYNVRSEGAVPGFSFGVTYNRYFSTAASFSSGMEYPLSGFDRVTMGIGFENNFSDITKDKGIDPMDIVTQKMVFIRIGLAF